MLNLEHQLAAEEGAGGERGPLGEEQAAALIQARVRGQLERARLGRAVEQARAELELDDEQEGEVEQLIEQLHHEEEERSRGFPSPEKALRGSPSRAALQSLKLSPFLARGTPERGGGGDNESESEQQDSPFTASVRKSTRERGEQPLGVVTQQLFAQQEEQQEEADAAYEAAIALQEEWLRHPEFVARLRIVAPAPNQLYEAAPVASSAARVIFDPGAGPEVACVLGEDSRQQFDVKISSRSEALHEELQAWAETLRLSLALRPYSEGEISMPEAMLATIPFTAVAAGLVADGVAVMLPAEQQQQEEEREQEQDAEMEAAADDGGIAQDIKNDLSEVKGKERWHKLADEVLGLEAGETQLRLLWELPHTLLMAELTVAPSSLTRFCEVRRWRVTLHRRTEDRAGRVRLRYFIRTHGMTVPCPALLCQRSLPCTTLASRLYAPPHIYIYKYSC